LIVTHRPTDTNLHQILEDGFVLLLEGQTDTDRQRDRHRQTERQTQSVQNNNIWTK